MEKIDQRIEELQQERKELTLQLEKNGKLLIEAKIEKAEIKDGISVGDLIRWGSGKYAKEGIVSRIDATYHFAVFYYAYKITIKGVASKKDMLAGSKGEITVLKKAEK